MKYLKNIPIRAIVKVLFNGLINTNNDNKISFSYFQLFLIPTDPSGSFFLLILLKFITLSNRND